jgi:hypothetical protein
MHYYCFHRRREPSKNHCFYRGLRNLSGRLAQLGERRVRNAEVEGSNPLPSMIVFVFGRLAQW